ncbi:hypothetical protein BLNAU_20186 [Blattamonas nauphoetae]|uniref:Uncharacterized protein n=1 Tax=Blattamonas nauphoetae TaxID=2049346 RepID=A0ABQ9WZE3_9EUKA|nr:hypothetical protein BLNAU_20186 [Blattamonas nauphoetae]
MGCYKSVSLEMMTKTFAQHDQQHRQPDRSFRVGSGKDSHISALLKNPPKMDSFSEVNSTLGQIDHALSSHPDQQRVLEINVHNPSPILNRVTSFLISNPPPADRTEDELDHKLVISLVMKLATLVKNGVDSVHYDCVSFFLVLVQRLSPIEQYHLFNNLFIRTLQITMHPVTVQVQNTRYHLMWVCLLSHLLSPLVNPSFIDERAGNSPSASEWMALAMTDVALPSLHYISFIIKNMSSFTHPNMVENVQSLSASLIVLTFFQPACRLPLEPLRLHHWQMEHWAAEENTNKQCRQIAYFFFLLSHKTDIDSDKTPEPFFSDRLTLFQSPRDQQRLYLRNLREEGFDDLVDTQIVRIRESSEDETDRKTVRALSLLSTPMGLNICNTDK